jgi:hypothetical protein
MITTLTLLTSVTHGTPSGNYDGSSQDWVSDAAKAADYYQGRGGVQTVGFNVTGFAGKITIEATLDSDAETAGWFDVLDFNDATVQRSESVVGNFTWIRARVIDFSAGTINLITVNY